MNSYTKLAIILLITLLLAIAFGQHKISKVEAVRGFLYPLNTPLPTPEPTPEPLIATVTAYSCGGLETDQEIAMNCPSLFNGEPKTANGTVPIPYKTIACDRANMGREFELEGIGKVKCTDTGGAIKGAGRFDLYVETVQEARKWGVRKINYKLVENKHFTINK